MHTPSTQVDFPDAKIRKTTNEVARRVDGVCARGGWPASFHKLGRLRNGLAIAFAGFGGPSLRYRSGSSVASRLAADFAAIRGRGEWRNSCRTKGHHGTLGLSQALHLG